MMLWLIVAAVLVAYVLIGAFAWSLAAMAAATDPERW